MKKELKDPYTRKLGVLVPVDLYERINKCFEWGERTRVLNKVLEWVVEKIEKHGKGALVILLREDNFDELLKTMEKKDGYDK